MKITKDDILNAWSALPDDKKHFLTLSEESNKLHIHVPYEHMTKDELSNAMCWLDHFDITGENCVHVSKDSSYSGVITLKDSSLSAEKSVIRDSTFTNTSVYGGRNNEICSFTATQSSLRSVNIKGKTNEIRDSFLVNLNINNVEIHSSRVTDKANTDSGEINCSLISRCFIDSERMSFSDRKVIGISVSSYKFNGVYLSIVDQLGETVALMEINRKTIFHDKKTYNLGVWEEQFVNKEQNLFIKMMNQKKLEMMNMFFDSLAFK